MDLRKAFDSMHHDLLIAKLDAYGITTNSLKLLKSYLTNRQQRVKIGNATSEWKEILKGVPQGSILFNIFINDMFHFITRADLANYADDNTICSEQPTKQQVVEVLRAESNLAIEWFTRNLMLANPQKFQALFLNYKEENLTFDLDTVTIIADDVVKLLGVHLDSKLNFENHISHICKKAGNHLNVLKRLTKFINKNDRMAIFGAFILCHFQLCSVVWHFCRLGSMTKMEKIQERALRFVHGDYTSDYNGLLSISKLLSLKRGRERSIATLTYKIMHNLAPSYLKDVITPTSNLKLRLPSFKCTRHGLNSFMYKAPRIWNTLPIQTRTASSLPGFKVIIKKWNGYSHMGS